MNNEQPLVEMRKVIKTFPGVRALDRVDFSLLAGEVHVLLGENGAGKSTLMKVLAGVHQADSGDILLGGGPIWPRTVLEAQRLGVVMVMQEFNLIPDLTVAENMVLVNRPEGSLLGRVRRSAMEAEAKRILDRLGIRVRPEVPVRRLSVAQRQMVEIAKAMSLEARVLVLDEPTAALSDAEVKRLFELIAGLKQSGIGIVYISHRFEEIFTVGDRVTVLRDGRLVSTYGLDRVSGEQLIRDMAGRELSELYPRRRVEPGEAALEVKGLSTAGGVHGVSFVLWKGEILGMAGLMGAGRTELAKAVFGAVDLTGGAIEVFGREVKIDSPRGAMDLGLGFCTEDRKEEGLFMDKSMAWNISITDLKSVLSAGLVSRRKEAGRARGFIDRLRIRPPDGNRPARALSGGTQQKVVLAKWLGIKPRILIMDEPTRGIDVGAKVEFYNLMDEFAAGGGAILLISSDLPELLAMSDRIVVMHEGGLAGERSYPGFDQEDILALATGVA